MAQPQRQTALLTLGRLPVALDIARGLADAGWRVLIAEPFALHLCRASRAVARCYRVSAPALDPARYLDDLRRIIAAEGVGLVVPVSEESLHVAALVGQLDSAVRVLSMPQPQMLALHDKLRFVRLAQSFRLAVPRTAAAGEPAAAGLARDQNFVCKPRHSCSGRGVSFHPRGSVPPTTAGLLVQEKLEGRLLSSFSIARDGRPLITLVYRGTVMSGSVAVCFERVTDAPEVEQWVAGFVAAARHSGFIAFDFIVDDTGRAVAIECNPRATSGIHYITSRALGVLLTGQKPEAPLLRLSPLLTESYSCYTSALSALRQRHEFRRRLRCLRQARDVVWSPHDPLPFLTMMVNSAPLIARALRRRRTFAEVAAVDIEWRAPPPAG